MKALFLAFFLALPLAGGWYLRGADRNRTAAGSGSAPDHSRAAHPESVVTIPVEVIASGRPPEWVLVRVADQSAPKGAANNQAP